MDDKKPHTLYVLDISHKHGTDITVWSTEQLARAALERYCREEWEEGDPPSDADELIEQYFDGKDLTAPRFRNESYDINPVEVDDPLALNPEAAKLAMEKLIQESDTA